MDRAKIIQTIAYRMGNVRNQDEAIGLELDLSIARLEEQEFLPWFLISESNSFELTAGENRVPVPDGFLKEYEEGALYYKDENNCFHMLFKKSQDMLKGYLSGEGAPEMYALTNKYFRVFPVPDKTYLLELIFYRKSETLNEDNNPWYDNAAELLIAETLWAMLASRKSKDADYWRGIAAERYMRLQAQDTERRIGNYELNLGGD